MFISINKLAKITGLSVKQLYRLTHEGTIPYIRSERKFFYNPDKVIEALNERAAESQVDSNG